MAYLSFQIRASGTGSTVGYATTLGAVDSVWTRGEWFREVSGYFDRLRVRVPYISPGINDDAADRITVFDLAKRHAEELAQQMQWRPLRTVDFSGGVAFLREAQNWGDVQVRATTAGSDSVLFANCTLESIETQEDENTGGVFVEAVFVRPREGFSAREPGENDQPFFRFLRTNEGATAGQTVVNLTQLRGAIAAAPRYEVASSGLVRAVVRVAYDADFGTRSIESVAGFVSTLAASLGLANLEYGSNGYGKAFVENRSENFGRLEYSLTGGSPWVTLFARCAVESISSVGDYGRAGVVVEIAFVAAMTEPTKRWIRWDRRAGGTGSVLSTTRMTPTGEDQSARSVSWRIEDDGVLRSAIIRVFVSGSAESRSLTALREYAASAKDAMLWHPAVIRRLARGKAKAINLHQNYGDLVLYDASDESVLATLLANCTLSEVKVIDDRSDDGAVVEYTFVTVADSVAV